MSWLSGPCDRPAMDMTMAERNAEDDALTELRDDAPAWRIVEVPGGLVAVPANCLVVSADNVAELRKKLGK